MAAVMEDLWPRCPLHHVDLEWDLDNNVLFCPCLGCDYARPLPGAFE